MLAAPALLKVLAALVPLEVLVSFVPGAAGGVCGSGAAQGAQ